MKFIYTNEVPKEHFGDLKATVKLIEMSKIFQIEGVQVDPLLCQVLSDNMLLYLFQEAVINLWLNNTRYEVKRLKVLEDSNYYRYYNGHIPDFGIEISFLKLCKMYPEMLKMENIKPIASFVTAKLFDFDKDSKKRNEFNYLLYCLF